MKYIGWTHYDLVRCLERAKGEPVAPAAIAASIGITDRTVQTYVSHLRQAYGYTAILGTPAHGYRIGEWPAMEPRRKYGEGRERAVRRRAATTRTERTFDSSAGVVVTAAGKALGL